MFVVIDGIDGAGKGTQLELVQRELESQWKTVKVLDYPRYGKPSAFAVEKYLNWLYGSDVSPKLWSLFYALDRFDDYMDYKNENNQYDYILANRYVSASMIHQWGKIIDDSQRQEFLKWLEDLEYSVFGIPKPDITLFLNVSPEMSDKLVAKKEKRSYIASDTNKDIHESDTDHMKNAYNVAQEIAASHSDWIKIDCEEQGEMLERQVITKKILEKII